MNEQTEPGPVASITNEGVAPGKFEVVIQDECCGAWMAINNSFRAEDDAWSEDSSFWNGVMIQLGDFDPWKQSETPSRVFDGVTFESGGNVVRTLSRAEFEDGIYWINVVAEDGDVLRNPPVEVEDFYRLHLDPLSNRTLHAFLHPMPGGITFWHRRATREWNQNENRWEETTGYDMEAGVATADSNHSSFTFTLTATNIVVTVHEFPKPIVRDWIWRNQLQLGEKVPAAAQVLDPSKYAPVLDPLGQVDRIVVLAKEGGGHGGHDNPPQG